MYLRNKSSGLGIEDYEVERWELHGNRLPAFVHLRLLRNKRDYGCFFCRLLNFSNFGRFGALFVTIHYRHIHRFVAQLCQLRLEGG